MSVNSYLLLYINPVNSPSKEPLIDELTRKMPAAFRQGKVGVIPYNRYAGGPITVRHFDDYMKAFDKKEDLDSFRGDNVFSIGNGWMGFHPCSCGADSTGQDSLLPNGEITNSLCIHYLAFHRDEISQEQLDRVNALDCGEEEPDAKELNAPQEFVEAKTREEFKKSKEYEYVVLENPVRDHLKIKRK